MKIFKIIILSLLIATQTQAAESPLDAPVREIDAADRARLETAALLLADAEASNRLAAVQEIVHQTGRGVTMPAPLRRLLVRATADPDAGIAALATRALDRRDYPPEPERGSDEEIRERAEVRRLRWAEEALFGLLPADRSVSDRLAAAHILVHQASRHSHWRLGLEWLVREAKRDTDFEIAYLAEQVLARHEGRPIDPRFVWLATRSQEATATRAELERRADNLYVATDDPNPNVRLSSLHWVLDVALSEGADSDRRILDALIAHRADPEPRIASFVRFALEGLSGDRHALREIYVGR